MQLYPPCDAALHFSGAYSVFSIVIHGVSPHAGDHPCFLAMHTTTTKRRTTKKKKKKKKRRERRRREEEIKIFFFFFLLKKRKDN